MCPAIARLLVFSNMWWWETAALTIFFWRGSALGSSGGFVGLEVEYWLFVEPGGLGALFVS